MKVQIQDQEVIKLDRFDKTNYARWIKIMLFLLTTVKVFCVLNSDLQPILNPNDDDSPKVKAKLITDKAKRDAKELKY